CWFHKKFFSERILTLAEVFEIFRERIGINVEIKVERLHRRQLDIVFECCKLITEFKMGKSILISSFHQKIIEQVKLLHPNIATGLLYDPIRQLMKPKISKAKAVQAEYIILNGKNLRNKTVRDIHAADLLLGEYTINTKHRFDRAIRFGMDVIITNDPFRIRRFLSIQK
ncbi:MAG: glycerophosphodiester phosphodiesterase, partial [Ignavibacteriales bacterium]|nr:glycerophosphodiester phosphodiesterase [Ignavibacteriales bacterium]